MGVKATSICIETTVVKVSDIRASKILEVDNNYRRGVTV